MSDIQIANTAALIGFIIVDAMIIMLPLRGGWLKQRNMEIFFPEWKDTKKSVIWFVIWSCCLLLNVGIAGLMFVFDDIKASTILTTIYFLYFFFLGTIYIIVKHNIRYLYDKRLEKLEKEKSVKDNTCDKTEKDK